MKRLLVIAALMANAAYAETTVGLDLASYHDTPGFNNTNPGAYVVFGDSTGSGPAIGSYLNSLNKQTNWVGYVSEARSNKVSVDLLFGIATGYKDNAVPMLVPSISYDVGNHNSVRLHYIPNLFDTPNVLHLSVEHRF